MYIKHRNIILIIIKISLSDDTLLPVAVRSIFFNDFCNFVHLSFELNDSKFTIIFNSDNLFYIIRDYVRKLYLLIYKYLTQINSGGGMNVNERDDNNK